MESLSDQWVDNAAKCHESGTKILDVLHRSAILPASDTVTSGEAASSKCLQQLTRSYEPSYGGFSEQP